MDRSSTPQRAGALRRYRWRATYGNGITITECVDEGAGPSIGFGDIPRAGMVRLALVDAATEREAAGFDLATGDVDLHGERVDPRMRSLAITGKGGVHSSDVFQFKTAHAERRADGSSSGTVVDFHVIGYSKTMPEGELRLELLVSPACGQARLVARLLRPPGSPPPNPLAFVSLARRPATGPSPHRHGHPEGR